MLDKEWGIQLDKRVDCASIWVFMWFDNRCRGLSTGQFIMGVSDTFSGIFFSGLNWKQSNHQPVLSSEAANHSHLAFDFEVTETRLISKWLFIFFLFVRGTKRWIRFLPWQIDGIISVISSWVDAWNLWFTIRKWMRKAEKHRFHTVRVGNGGRRWPSRVKAMGRAGGGEGRRRGGYNWWRIAFATCRNCARWQRRPHKAAALLSAPMGGVGGVGDEEAG